MTPPTLQELAMRMNEIDPNWQDPYAFDFDDDREPGCNARREDCDPCRIDEDETA
jgi:hypothetical protein